MKIIMKKVDDLIPYHNNPRINDGAVKHVASSIAEFGFLVPMVIDENNVVVCGHTRMKAALKLGLKEVPTILADDLTPAQIKAFRIADNSTSTFSIWDFPLLEVELEELKELDFDYDFGLEDEKDESEYPESGDAENIFTAEYKEEHNYVILYFDNEIDWQSAVEKLGIKSVHATASKPGTNYVLKGTGRVLKGSEVIERILD